MLCHQGTPENVRLEGEKELGTFAQLSLRQQGKDFWGDVVTGALLFFCMLAQMPALFMTFIGGTLGSMFHGGSMQSCR